MRTQIPVLLVAAAAGVAALLPGTASAQQYRGYSRTGNYVPGNYGMTRPTGYAPSNYGMTRPTGYAPSNYGNPSASVPINSFNAAAATPGTAVPIGAVPALPGTPVGPYLTPWTASSLPPVNPPPTAAVQAGVNPNVPAPNAAELATPSATNPPPPGAEQTPPPVPSTPPAAGEQATVPGAAPTAAAPNALGAVVPSFNGAFTAGNPFAPASSLTPRGTAPLAPRSFNSLYSAPQYQSSFYAPLVRVYGYRGY